MADDAGGHGSAGWSHTGRLCLRRKCRGLRGGGGGVGEAVTEVGVARMCSGGGAQSGGGGEDSGGGGLGEAGTVRWSHALMG